MERLLERADSLDGIVVETSGLALPEPLIAALHWPQIRTRIRLNGVVALVDGEALAGISRLVCLCLPLRIPLMEQ